MCAHVLPKCMVHPLCQRVCRPAALHLPCAAPPHLAPAHHALPCAAPFPAQSYAFCGVLLIMLLSRLPIKLPQRGTGRRHSTTQQVRGSGGWRWGWGEQPRLWQYAGMAAAAAKLALSRSTVAMSRLTVRIQAQRG